MTRTSRREQIHIRDGENARLAIAVDHHGKARNSLGMWDRGESGLPPARPLEAIAADLGEAMAEVVFAGLDGLERDYRAMCERFGIGRK